MVSLRGPAEIHERHEGNVSLRGLMKSSDNYPKRILWNIVGLGLSLNKESATTLSSSPTAGAEVVYQTQSSGKILENAPSIHASKVEDHVDVYIYER